MTPFDTAAKWHKESGHDFAANVEFFAREGVLYFDEKCAIMAMPVDDTWFVWFWAGEKCLQRLFEIAPYRLPFVAWSRLRIRNGDRSTKPLRSYPFERVQKLIQANLNQRN